MGISKELLTTTLLVLDELKGRPTVVGTGFAMEDTEGRTYIVTNQHVADPATRVGTQHIHVRPFTEEKDGKANQEEVKAIKGMAIPHCLIASSKELDLAVIRLDLELGGPGVEQGRIHWESRVGRDEIVRNRWWEGTPILTIGYPRGIGWEGDIQRQLWPTARSGVIARMQDWLARREKTILVDGATLGGQSGSPVFLQTTGQAAATYRFLGVVQARKVDEVKGLRAEMRPEGDLHLEEETLGLVDLHLQHVIPAENLEGLLAEADRRFEEWRPTTSPHPRG